MATNQNDPRNQQTDNRSNQQKQGNESSKKETNPNNPTAFGVGSQKDEIKKQNPGMDSNQSQPGKSNLRDEDSRKEEEEEDTDSPSARIDRKSEGTDPRRNSGDRNI